MIAAVRVYSQESIRIHSCKFGLPIRHEFCHVILKKMDAVVKREKLIIAPLQTIDQLQERKHKMTTDHYRELPPTDAMVEILELTDSSNVAAMW